MSPIWYELLFVPYWNHWSVRKEITRCTEIVSTRFVNMRKFLCQPKTAIPVRLRTLNWYVWSLFLYGSETWTLKQGDSNKLQRFQMWLWRRMERITWTYRRNNAEVLRQINAKLLLIQTAMPTKKKENSLYTLKLRKLKEYEDRWKAKYRTKK